MEPVRFLASIKLHQRLWLAPVSFLSTKVDLSNPITLVDPRTNAAFRYGQGRYIESDSKVAGRPDDYKGFVREFNGAFGMYTREDAARTTFMNMFMKYAPNEPKQYETFREDDTAFKELWGQVGDDFVDAGIKYLYLHGLSRKIQEPFMHRDVGEMTFEDVRCNATRFDEQKQALRYRPVPEPAKKPSSHSNTS
jgi:hypothetical protein